MPRVALPLFSADGDGRDRHTEASPRHERADLARHALVRQSVVEHISSSFALRQLPCHGAAPIAHALKEAQLPRQAVCGARRDGEVALCSLARIVGSLRALAEAAVLGATAACLADTAKERIGVHKETMAPHQGEERAIGRSVVVRADRGQGIGRPGSLGLD